MNKPKAQGTAFETAFVRQAQAAGLLTDRMPEGGMNDAGDVWIGDTPYPNNVGPLLSADDISIVAWSRLVKGAGSKRVADGVRSVIVISTDDFLRIARLATDVGISFVVECKATERLNVTRTLHQAQTKLRRWKER